jgi:membrane protein required for beta-lactamase induction
MDSSAFRNFNLAPLFWWAIFGMCASGLLGACILGGAVWWAIHHIQFV